MTYTVIDGPLRTMLISWLMENTDILYGRDKSDFKNSIPILTGYRHIDSSVSKYSEVVISFASTVKKEKLLFGIVPAAEDESLDPGTFEVRQNPNSCYYEHRKEAK